MEYCSTTIFVQYDYSLPLNIVGVYRPPVRKPPSYERVLSQILEEYEKKQVTTLVVGDLNVTSWKNEYNDWVEQVGLWELSNPLTPTFQKGTTPDATVMAIGKYFPEGILPQDLEEEGEQEELETYPAYVTENPILGDHMALFLTFCC